MVRRKRLKLDNRVLLRIIVGFLFFYSLFILVKSVKTSYLFQKKDRLNLVFYGQEPVFVSLGFSDPVNYIATFDNDLKIFVPGGYEMYKIGSLGKLSQLDEKPEIIKKAFSSATSSYVDFYFYPEKAQIFVEEGREKERESFSVPKLNLLRAILKLDYYTNANLIDRLYLFFVLANKTGRDFSKLDTLYFEEEGEEKIFLAEEFGKDYKGYFYKKSLRQEGKDIQIVYKNYQVASLLTRIVEGEGIRVAGFEKNEAENKSCIIVDVIEEEKDKGWWKRRISQTAQFLAARFGCKIEKTKDSGDIRFILGKKLEEEWQ